MKKIDHKTLGETLNLFLFSKKVGSGLPLWLNNGVILKNNLKNFIINNINKNKHYNIIETPHIGNKALYVASGHWDKYNDNNFKSIVNPDNKKEFLLKPMNCPHHCEIFKYYNPSYRDLPKRFIEFGTVYRYEKSGELNGLIRSRGFTQDDSHIFCTKKQLLEEVQDIIDFIISTYKFLTFNKYKIQVSLKSNNNENKYIGKKKDWEESEAILMDVLKNKKLEAQNVYGEAAFYGPKLDFMIKDNLNREWQLGTIQIDYNLPKRFNLKYLDKNNLPQRPVIIHYASFGSLERLIAILLEHTSGNLPIWLSPCKVIIININKECINYSKNILNLLKISNISTEIDIRNESVNKKIREAEIKKIPFMIIIGNKEKKNQMLSVRKRQVGDIGNFNLEEFKNLINNELII